MQKLIKNFNPVANDGIAILNLKANPKVAKTWGSTRLSFSLATFCVVHTLLTKAMSDPQLRCRSLRDFGLHVLEIIQ